MSSIERFARVALPFVQRSLEKTNKSGVYSYGRDLSRFFYEQNQKRPMSDTGEIYL